VQAVARAEQVRAPKPMTMASAMVSKKKARVVVHTRCIW
jgi:hypothetical protein